MEGILYALYPNGDVKWSYGVPKMIEFSPAIGSDGTIYFVSRNKKTKSDKAGR